MDVFLRGGLTVPYILPHSSFSLDVRVFCDAVLTESGLVAAGGGERAAINCSKSIDALKFRTAEV